MAKQKIVMCPQCGKPMAAGGVCGACGYDPKSVIVDVGAVRG